MINGSKQLTRIQVLICIKTSNITKQVYLQNFGGKIKVILFPESKTSHIVKKQTTGKKHQFLQV